MAPQEALRQQPHSKQPSSFAHAVRLCTTGVPTRNLWRPVEGEKNLESDSHKHGAAHMDEGPVAEWV